MNRRTPLIAIANAIAADAPRLNAEAAATKRQRGEANQIDEATVTAVLASRHAGSRSRAAPR